MNNDWPTDLHAGFTALPRRCLFCNECVRVTLTGLSAGQSVAGVAPPRPLILLVTFGTLGFEAQSEVVFVREGQMLALNPGVKFRLSATEAADFLVLCASCPMRRGVCGANSAFTPTPSSALASESSADKAPDSSQRSRETSR